MKNSLKLLILLSIALLGLIAIHAVYAQEPDPTLEEIRRAIEEKGYDWQADETSVSSLSEDEQRRLLGARLEEEKTLIASIEAQEQGTVETFSYPSSVNWKSSMTPVKDQKNCGSCVAFATLGTIEGRYKIQNGLSLDLSESHIFYCGGGQCDYGWYPSDGMNFAVNTGVADEACFPYVDYDVPCLNRCSDWASRVKKIDNWWGTANTSKMKQALADGGPIELTMAVYQDFMYYSGGVYRHTWGSLQGGHAVTVVGYDDSGGYWIAKNSWSTGWGESGYFEIAYGQCEIDDYAYVPELSSQPTHSISGYVRDVNNQGIAGVVVTVSSRGTATTNSSGYYKKTNVPPGSYTVTPDKAGCQFTPSSRSVTVSSSDVGADFTAKCSSSGDSVSGYVRDINGQGIDGINVQIATQGTATTNSNGYYVKTNVPAGTYTVKPSQTNCTFDPPSRAVTVSGSDVTVPDFLGACASTGYKIYLPVIKRDSTSCKDTQVIQNGSFESGDVMWTRSSGIYPIIGQYYSHSGDWSAWFGGYDDADDRLYQRFSVPAGIHSAYLTFYLYVYSTDDLSQPYDGFHAELHNSLGGPLENFLWADNTMHGGWYKGWKKWPDFSAYDGQTLRLFFQGTTDQLYYTNFFVDDVNLDVYCGSLPAARQEESEGQWGWEKVDAPSDLLPAAAQEKK